MSHDFVTPASNIEPSASAVQLHLSNQSQASDTVPSSDRVSLLDRNTSKLHSTPDEVKPQGDMTRIKSSWATYWVVGSYFTCAYVFYAHSNTTLTMDPAWSLAIAHYLFFSLLDGKDTSNTLALRQSQVSTISLLLVTAFRATIVVVLGTCFAQYLWYLLRTRCLKISLIEDLFQMRNNILCLTNPGIFRKVPLLFLAAVLSWLVPLATVYPPGALTIQPELHTYFENVNASIMNPVPSQLDLSIYSPSLANLVRVGRQGTEFDYSQIEYMYVQKGLP